MVVALKRNVSEEKRAQLIDWLKGMGIGVHISEGEYSTVLGLIGDTQQDGHGLDREPRYS